MPYESKRVKEDKPSRAVAHDPHFTASAKQAAAPAPFFTNRDTGNEDVPVQGQFMQPKAAAGEPDARTPGFSPPRANDTGLPDNLKAGMEDLSGFSLDDVNVHYNSDKPAQLKAYAYTQGRDIHVGPGQEKHLPHEAWHVVQQKQGRVNATMQMKGVNINDDEGLEKEADLMGRHAMQRGAFSAEGVEAKRKFVPLAAAGATVQRLTGFEVESNIPVYHNTGEGRELVNPDYQDGFTPEIRNFLFGGLKYGLSYGFDPEGHFSLTADHNELQVPHGKLIHLLSLSGFLKPEIRKRSMANLEYITPPRDELATGSKQLFQEDVEHVKGHVNSTLGVAKSGQSQPVRDTGDWMLTGVPVKDILAWVRLHKAPAEAFETVLNEMEALITNNLYVQETTGVLPEDIPALYESGSKRMKGDKLTPATVMADFMEAAVQLGVQAYENAAPDKSPGPFVTQKGAVVGFLTYLASHLLADSLSLTNFVGVNSTDKNLFPYFPKVPLSTAFQALPQDLREEKTTWKTVLESLCNISATYGVKYWESKGLTINKSAYESKIFKEGNPYYAVLKEEEADVQYETPVAQSAFDKLVEGEKVSINVEKNLPGLDKPHSEVEKATGQQAIPVEDRYWGAKFEEKMSTDTIEGAFMQEANAAIARQFGHIPGSEQERMQSGINDKPDYQGMQQERLETKFKSLQDFSANMKEQADIHLNSIKGYEAGAEHFEQLAKEQSALIAQVQAAMARLDELLGVKKSMVIENRSLIEEKKGLQGPPGKETPEPDEQTAVALRKIEDALAQLKLRYLEVKKEEEVLLQSVSEELGMESSEAATVKKKFNDMKRTSEHCTKLAKQARDNMARAIKDEEAFKRISEESVKFVPTSDKLPEVKGYEDGQAVETDLNMRVLEQQKLANTWQNRLDDKDVLYTFDKAKMALEKDLKISLAKQKRKAIKPDMLQDDGAKAAIEKILAEAAGAEAVILKYDSLTVTDASPQVSALLFEYMQAGGQYTAMIGEAYDIYVKTMNKEHSMEEKEVTY